VELRAGASQLLECGDLSPLYPLGRLVGQAEPQQSGSACNPNANDYDGDESPAESGDKSPHSIGQAASPVGDKT